VAGKHSKFFTLVFGAARAPGRLWTTQSVDGFRRRTGQPVAILASEALAMFERR
jgi:hypothetical protein